uniref:Uncharacterized protein n=1 Tax=Anopheles atroparvus TaxID=41427 RepID=A0A182IW90_ANOAO
MSSGARESWLRWPTRSKTGKGKLTPRPKPTTPITSSVRVFEHNNTTPVRMPLSKRVASRRMLRRVLRNKWRRPMYDISLRERAGGGPSGWKRTCSDDGSLESLGEARDEAVRSVPPLPPLSRSFRFGRLRFSANRNSDAISEQRETCE